MSGDPEQEYFTDGMVEDIIIAAGDKVVVFTAFNDGVARHAKALSNAEATITGAQNAEQRMQAVDGYQGDPAVRVAVCNITAGGDGATPLRGCGQTPGRCAGACS